MKCKIPEISWHNRDPVLSVDIQPKSGDSSAYRLASGGTDAHVLIWYMNLHDHDIELDLAADLTRHQRAVNVVKWSPNGEMLASGDDESVVFIWKQKAENEVINITETTNEQDKEVWITMKVLRGHMEDIYDLCWSPNSQFLVSGSVDNSAMIWDVHKGKYTAMLTDHKGFVQGVTWDPKNQYVATLSTDRYLRIFDIQTKKVVHRIHKSTLPMAEGTELQDQRVCLYHDDTLQTFFRRLSFTPDGKFLLTPAGFADYGGTSKPLNTTYVFSRFAFKQPAIVLPCPDQYTVAVRACPLLYRLRPFNPDKNPPVIPLPYRMIFAVATKSSVYFYDTQQQQPFALISNIHYTRLTDLTWSNDGRIVVVSSTDGFCSLITFEEGELGEEYEDSQAVLEAALNNEANSLTASKKLKKQKENENTEKQVKVKKISAEENLNVNTEKPSAERPPLAEANDKKSEANTATPIAFRKKPKESPNTNLAVVESQEKEVLAGEIKAATPIAFRKKPKEETKPENKTNETEVKPTDTKEEKPSATAQEKKEDDKDEELLRTPPKDVPSSLPLKTVEIILDKEILSSDEKFESPEKKAKPATPISVRRQPRTPNSNTPATQPSTPKQFSPLPAAAGVAHKNPNTPLQAVKKATPIAVRRTPRALIPPATPTPVNEKTLVEEAMDAWPIKYDNNKDKNESPSIASKDVATEAKVPPNIPYSETTCGKTEDIHLVYEDTVEENNVEMETNDAKEKTADTSTAATIATTATPTTKEKVSRDESVAANIESNKSAKKASPQKDQTPKGNKTPRRVPLKTISTPKSKKKLIE